MGQYSFTFKIEAETEAQAREIAKALDVAYKRIPTEDLIWIGKKIQEDPKVISKVKKLANNPLVKNLW
jgi:hypothetical protein